MNRADADPSASTTQVFLSYAREDRASAQALAAALGADGHSVFGAIDQRAEISADWRPAFAPALSFDTKLAWRSAETATVSNVVEIPARAQIDIGGRYRFRLASNAATLRMQVTNLFDVRSFELRGAGAYGPIPGRLVQGYLTVDL